MAKSRETKEKRRVESWGASGARGTLYGPGTFLRVGSV